MEEPLRIPLASLEQICISLLERVRATEGESFLIERDYFWELTKDERSNVYEEPTEHTVGQISECWANVSSMLEDPSREIGYGLVWVAQILRAIGDEAII